MSKQFWTPIKKRCSRLIDTLVEDIQALFTNGHTCDPANVEAFGSRLAETVSKRLQEVRNEAAGREGNLRLSSIGKPDRQLYYSIHGSGGGGEVLGASTRFKFLYGDILEELLLFLARESGHTVTDEQKEVEVNGVLGHIDAIIDGVVVDVKSASSQAFKRFDEKLDSDDPFSYIEQLSGYSVGLGGLDGGFLVVDKMLGHLRYVPVDAETMRRIDVPARIDHLKEVMASDVLPERCYEPVPEGKSGNMKLPVGCSYCSHKFHCWADANDGIGLRSFLYASGPTHLTTVVSEPKVMEITF